MMWANTVLASGSYIVGVVVYTGIETRQAKNTSKARFKVGLLENEINNLSKVSVIRNYELTVDIVRDSAWTQCIVSCPSKARAEMVYLSAAIPHSLLYQHTYQAVQL